MIVELLSATQRDTITAPLLRENLDPLGLTEIAPRRWIDGSQPPVRRLFELQLLKGAALKACWGFSLDFVPHISGRSVRWHRSDKAAMLDVIIDPRNLAQPTYLFGVERFRAELRALLPDAVTAARRDWSIGSTYEGMLHLIRTIQEEQTNCFGYWNYTQLPVAFAFLAAKVGDLPLANRELDEYLAGISVDQAVAARLRKLLHETACPA